jgi:transglutaminase-like putative cysteine protease
MRFSILTIVFLFSQICIAQNLQMSVLTIPEGLSKNANSVVREYKQVYRVRSRREATLSVRRVVTLLNGKHNRENQLVVHYDNETKITNFKATLYDVFGNKIREAKKSEIEDVRALSGGQFYTDDRVKTTTLTHTSYPYTIEFEYEVKMEDFGAVSSPSMQPQVYDQATQHASLVAYVPQDNELLYKAHDIDDPVKSTDQGYTVYEWEVENLKAKSSEPEAPPSTQTLPFLRTVLRDFSIGEYELTNRNWEEFGAKMLQLHDGIRELPAGLARKVNEVTAGLTTDLEKIDVLYKLMQERTRYVGVQLGVGGWQPFSATYVEENKYGDCKALSNYMGAMLAEVDITAYPVLVYWGDRQSQPAEENFTASAFNHMILYVPGEDMYLECTSNLAPTGYLGDGKQDRNVVWLTPEGGKLVRTPAAKPADNGYVRGLDLEVHPDGSAAFKLRTSYVGASQESYRMLASQIVDHTKQLEVLNRWGSLPDVSGTGYVLEVDPGAPHVDLAYETTLPRYVRKLGKRMFVPINKLYRHDDVPDKIEGRQFPILRTAARFYVDTVNLTLPENLEVESLGEEKTVYEHAAGEYRAEVIVAPGKITWIRTYKLFPVQLPASEYEGYREFFLKVSKAERRQVVLREKRTK